MPDLYTQLTPAQQTAFRVALFSKITPAKCSFVDLSTVTSADSLTDAGNRGLAIDCYQAIAHVGSSGAGVLDQATYNSIMGQGMSTGEKVVIGAVAIGVLALLFGRKKRRARR